MFQRFLIQGTVSLLSLFFFFFFKLPQNGVSDSCFSEQEEGLHLLAAWKITSPVRSCFKAHSLMSCGPQIV